MCPAPRVVTTAALGTLGVPGTREVHSVTRSTQSAAPRGRSSRVHAAGRARVLCPAAPKPNARPSYWLRLAYPRGTMHARLPLALALAVCTACGQVAPEPPAVPRSDGCEAPHPDEGHSFEVYLVIKQASGKRPFCPGQELSAGDELWVNVELDTASQVRLVYLSPDGEAGELLRQDEADLTRSALFRAPEGLLVRTPGEAQLVIVASRAPLDESDPVMGTMLDVIRDTGTLVQRDGSLRPPPPGQEPASGVQLDSDMRGLHADFDERGVAMLTIPLRSGP
jgi:hypothetical protein